MKGNSGLYFRIAETGSSGVTGFQAEIDSVQDVGGIYETNGRSWIAQPTAEEVKKWFKPGQWDTMVVHALGGRIETDPGRKEGNLALRSTAARTAKGGSRTWRFWCR